MVKEWSDIISYIVPLKKDRLWKVNKKNENYEKLLYVVAAVSLLVLSALLL